ncbi:UDP-N-acetylmuramate--L-alanine ligase [Spectribacter hydrogenoxidans]|uniref:UDP-N-acetylmuramate--L-alanine ligase n=1 Tax=Spectribacter hydrogenoxidans TaxID=3075608 RepID=A0ABU3BXL6_9GAMM|nr:UDP-N-acetylmuramate--L-alanine ligase [Salinisphaera sp. W335]MDT0633876.1 UDP-N-acetylmuramate--L-alanine ligase [Salinisphaera sp. W335]
MNATPTTFQPLSQRPMRRVQTVHFVGIGGVGMAGIAEVLLNLGYTVSGSDIREGAATRRLTELGAAIRIGHDAANATGADVVVTSSAVSADNPEVLAARERLVPVVPRAEMLAELMRFRYGIAVAGTHGKTTTTSLVASVLAEGGLDPTFIVGGKVLGAGTNARLGESPYIVAEADESDASFLFLTPMLAVVTNIDADHLEAYEGDFAKLIDTFVEFIHHLPFYGLAVVCVDDPVVRQMLPRVGRPVLTYGIDHDADLRAENLITEGPGTRFELRIRDHDQVWPVHLNLPGRHNVLNALAAAAVARELGVAMDAIQRALSGFAGIGRRCEVLGEIALAGHHCLLVDDYGHHPRELSSILQAVHAAWPERRLVVVFQPHRFTRTRDLFEDFCEVLAGLDVLVLCDIYPAGEARIADADGRALARGVRARGRVNPVFVGDVHDLPDVLAGVVADNDVILTLGAGDIGAVAAGMAVSHRIGDAP